MGVSRFLELSLELVVTNIAVFKEVMRLVLWITVDILVPQSSRSTMTSHQLYAAGLSAHYHPIGARRVFDLGAAYPP